METGDYTNGELSGRVALDYMPLDNWAHHALAHNFEESDRALQVSRKFYKKHLTTFLHKGLKFLSNTESHWTAGTTFSLHLWWHEALLHLQQGNPQE